MTASVTEVAYCYSEDGKLHDHPAIAGATNTDATHFRMITVAPNNRHNGKVDNSASPVGFTLDIDATTSTVINFTESYGIVEWLRIRNFNAGTGRSGIVMGNTATYGTIARYNIVHNNTGCTTGCNGILKSNNASAPLGLAYNNIVANITGADTSTVRGINASRGFFYNNTVYNITNTGGGEALGFDGGFPNSPTTFINNVATNCTTEPFDGGPYNTNSDYNACDAASCTSVGGTHDLNNLNGEDLYTDLTANAEDLHLASTTANSVLIDSGSDVSAGLVCTAGTDCYDIDNDVIPYPALGDWDIGADEEDTASPVLTLDITGIAYANDGTTPLTGTARTVAVRANGGDATTAETNTGTGAYSISVTQPAAGSTITVYLNAETETANTITITDGSTAITANLVDDRVIIQADNSTNAITIDDLVDYDSTTNDTDMLFAATDASPDTLVVEDGNQLYINASDTFTPEGNVTVGTGGINIAALGIWTATTTETIANAGNWANSGTFTSATGTVTFNPSSGTTTINTGGTGTTQDFNNLTINTTNGAIVQLITNDCDIDGTLTISAGTLDMNGRSISTTTSFSNTGTLKLQGAETVSWTTNDTDSGTWEYAGDGTGAATTQTVKDFGANDYFKLIINDTSASNKDTFSLGAAVDINDDFVLTLGTFSVGGSNYAMDIASGWADTGAGSFTEGTGTVTFSGTGEINANEAFNDVTLNTSGTMRLEAALDVDDDLTITAGALDVSTNNLGVNVGGDWSNSGTFTERSGAVSFDGSGAQAISTAETWYDLTINNSAGSPSDSVDVDPAGVQVVANTLTITDGQYTPYTGDDYVDVSIGANGILKPDASAVITVSGNWSNSGAFTHNNSDFTFDGSVAQGITGATTWDNLIINNSAGSPSDSVDVDPSGIQTIAGLLNISDGQWSSITGDDYASVTIGSQGILKPDASASITVSGNWTTTGTFTNNNSDFTFDGSSAQTISGANTWNNLTISNSSASPDDDNDVDPGAVQTIAGTLNVADGQWTPYTGDDYAIVTIGADGIIKPDASASLTVSGAWTNNGTFTNNSSLVTLDGASQSLTGSATFYQLTKSVTSADTLTFDNTVTQTVANTLTLNGATGQKLSLRSDVTGSAFGLVLSTGGTQVISYLDVKDSDATGGVTLTDTSTSTDSGNNTNWVFTVASTGETPRLGGSALGRQKLYPIPGKKPIIIGNDSPFASSRYVMLYFDVLNATEMNLLFNQDEFNESNSNNWSNYVMEKSWDLGSDDGLKKFLAKFRSMDNEVSNPYMAMVTLDFNAPSAPIIQVPKKNQQFNTNNPTFFGQTEPNSKVSLKIGSRLYRFESPADGSWQINITPALPRGDYLLEVRSEDWAGNVSPTVSVPFRIVKVLEKVTVPSPTEPAKPGLPTGEPGEEVVPPFVFPPFGEAGPPTGEGKEEYIQVIPEEIPAEKLEEYWFKKQEEAKGAIEKTTATIGQGLNNFQQTTQRIVRGAVGKIGQGLTSSGKTTVKGLAIGWQQTNRTINSFNQGLTQLVSPLTKVFLNPDLTMNRLAKAVNAIISPFEKISQKVRQSLVVGGKTTIKGLALVAQKANDGLMTATQTSGQLAQRTRTDLFNKLKQLKPAPEPTITQELAREAKPEEIPTLVPKTMPPDVVMVKSRKGNLNLARAGQIELLGGMKVYSFIRPSVEPKRVVARLYFEQYLSLESQKQVSAGGWQAVKPAEAAEVQAAEVQAMEWQVLEKAYQKLQEAVGIYMVELDIPQVSGIYTLQTEVELAEGGSKLYDLKAEVKNQGYVYKKVETDVEGRVAKAKITLYWLNPKTNQYEIWPGNVYDQNNPQITNDTGRYVFLAPAGQYYLTVEKDGYRFYQSDIFELKQAGPINKAIEIQKENWLKKLNPFK